MMKIIILLALMLIPLGADASTLTAYSSTADGYIASENIDSNWAAARGATTGNGANTGNGTGYITAGYASWCDEDFCYTNVSRACFFFDTSGLGSGSTINSAVLYIYVDSISTPDSVTWTAQKGTFGASLTTADFDSVFPNLNSGAYGVGNITSTGWATLTFNGTGLADINKTGITKICLRERTHDYDNVSPGAEIHYEAAIRMTESTGTASDPYLLVDYTAGAGATPKFLITEDE